VRAQGQVKTVLLVVLAARLASAGTASVEGVVALPPAAPPPLTSPRYPLAANYAVEEPDAPAAIVFLDGTGDTPQPRRASLGQHGYQFRPGIIAVTPGSVIAFPNLDDEYHSVFSYSKARRFDLGRYRKEEKPAEVSFDTPGVVRLYCEIHDHMRGTILVLDTPYFTTTDAQGRFRLTGLPAGRFVLKAWIDENDVRELPVELRDGAVAQADFPRR